jgi:hypothetical protein
MSFTTAHFARSRPRASSQVLSRFPAARSGPGTLRYKVGARQACGLYSDAADQAIGRSPATGWSKTTIK